MYQHSDERGMPIDLPVGKVVCIGRNYRDHIEEMQSLVPVSPLLFIKPRAAMCVLSEPVRIPEGKGACHNELELAVLLSAPLKNASPQEAESAIWGVGLGLDLTLRDLQQSLKAQGYPWERAKAFDFSCPLSGFVPKSQLAELDALTFTLSINNECRQQGNSAMMLHPVVPLIAHMSTQFSLDAGDVILTGTPKGVGPMHNGDTLQATLGETLSITSRVVQL
ncbi:fumarylacetoacetate hydrolase family protein [Alteromonas halophila]|uniref:Isomerase/hydrolase n=1 Tax=Alteromonas halophila TaxID=516698 RepID=A0A918N1Q5_9ALTE|nr:fumarylacetoacetate hydrolase family protein [Alteromonas halophila]GGW94881.1 isomerase/hydrolase [Alteromonas halophila]